MASSSSIRRNYLNFSHLHRTLDDDHENLSHRPRPKHNLVCWLRDREYGYTKSRVNRFIAKRTHVYRAIHPSYSILMCTVPQAVYIRRFSPNGQYLLAFSHDLESLMIYNYNGFERIYPDLIQCSPSTNYTRLDENGENSRQNLSDAVNCEKLRDHAFNKIFKHHATIQIRSSSTGYSLNRNHIYCLFSRDQYAIICASKLVNEQQHPPYNQLVQSNEDLNPLSRFYFEHFLIFLIDYSRGIICQQLEFQFDRIGLTIYQSTLAILSIQHQKLHLYHIDEKHGKLIELLTVGKFAQTEEEFLYKYSLPKHLLTMSPRLLHKKNLKRSSSSMFDRWDDSETSHRQRKRIRDHLSDYQNSDSQSSPSSSRIRSSFVREELHRPLTPPSTRILIHSNDDNAEQQPNFNIIGEGNDLPTNLAQSIFQRDNRFNLRDFITYPNTVRSSDYDHDMSAIANDNDDDDDDNDDDDDDAGSINLTPIDPSRDRIVNESNNDYWSLIQNQILLPMNDKQLCTLKQRLLTYLYKRAKQNNKQMRFIHSFNDYLASKFYKVQFLTNHIILLKFAHETIVNKRQQEQQMHYALFVVYNIRTSTILNIYDDSSSELANIFEKYNDDFRYSSSHGLINYRNLEFFPLSTYAGRRQFEHTYHHLTSTGDYDSVKRLLMQLPLRTITHTISPYLDLNLYSYDDKIVHIDDMIKTCPNNPVRFFSRDCQRMKFQLTLTNRSIILPQFTTTDNPTTAAAAAPPATTTTTTTIVTPTIANNTAATTTTANAVFIPNNLTTNRRTTLATLWHPIEPFCITIQRWPRDLDNIHNFHLYRPPNLK